MLKRHIRIPRFFKSLPPAAETGARTIGACAYGCYAWVLFLLMMLFGGGLIVLLQRPAQGRRVARIAARILFRVAGMPVSAGGLDRLPATPHILLINHTSFLDPVVLSALLPSSPGYAFTTRRQFESQRLLYPLVRALGTIVFKRSDETHGSGNVESIMMALSRGERLVIFPEGGFAPEPGIKPFHTGAFVAAARARVPVVVAGLRGARTALRLGTWLPHRTAIRLEIGPAFVPNGTSDGALLEASEAARMAMVPLSGEFERSA